MFLPLGDSPNPVGFKPWVTWGFIAVNVAVFLFVTLPLSSQGVDPNDPLALEYLRAVRDDLPPGLSLEAVARQLTAYDLFVFEYGFKPAAPQILDLFTSMFLHGGFLHLGGNMLFLWIYGDNVEHRLGRANYFVTYIGTGLVATLTFAMFASASKTPLVGASGAISGVLGLYFLMFPRNMVKVFVGLFPFIFDVFWIRARWVLGVYVIVDNIIPFVAGAASNVAYGAHLGGFFAGLGIAWVVEARGGQKPSFGRSSASDQAKMETATLGGAEPVDGNLEAVRQAIDIRDLERAVRFAARLDPSVLATLDPRDLYVVARGLAERGREDLAGRALRRALRRNMSSPASAATVHLALGELRLAQGQPSAAYQHLLEVLELAPGTPDAARAEAALHALAQAGSVRNRW